MPVRVMARVKPGPAIGLRAAEGPGMLRGRMRACDEARESGSAPGGGPNRDHPGQKKQRCQKKIQNGQR